MHIALTDVLTCPRCGPGFGLILLANRIEDRRVLDGVLGCANCREQYAVRDGGGWFGGSPAVPAGTVDDGATMRIAALLGVTRGPGFLLVAGPAANVAGALADMVPDVEVIATAYDAPAAMSAERPGVSRIGLAGRTLPLTNGKVLGVALSGSASDILLEEGARVLSPSGRLVVEAPPADIEKRLHAAGLRVLVRDDTTVVAARR